MSSCCSCARFDISSVATEKILFIWQENDRSESDGGMLSLPIAFGGGFLLRFLKLHAKAQEQTRLHLQLAPSWTPFLAMTVRWPCGEKKINIFLLLIYFGIYIFSFLQVCMQACRYFGAPPPPPPKKKKNTTNWTNKQVITLKILIKQYNSFFLFISLNLKALWTCTCSSS